MDYLRIYNEFILDRKSKPIAHGYTERHHVMPRSLGGTDEPSNIIRLTPEDHYFAHLLLAKHYGGGQWGGVHCMAKMIIEASSQRSVIASRYMVGIARRRFAEFQSNRRSGSRQSHQDRICTIYNDDGRFLTGSRTDLSRQAGVSLASISRLCNGIQPRTKCGWYISKSAADEAIRSKSAHGARYSRAGKNKLAVVRVDCGTIYSSVTDAASAWRTDTSNISRSIRTGVKAGSSHWRYARHTEHAQSSAGIRTDQPQALA